VRASEWPTSRQPTIKSSNQSVVIIPSAVSHSVSQCTVSHSVSPSVSAQSQSAPQSVVRSGSAVSQSAVSFFLVWVSCVSPKHSQLTHSHSLTHSLTRFNRPPRPTHPPHSRASSLVPCQPLTFTRKCSAAIGLAAIQSLTHCCCHSLHSLSLTHSLTHSLSVTDRPTAD